MDSVQLGHRTFHGSHGLHLFGRRGSTGGSRREVRGDDPAAARLVNELSRGEGY